jgi:signal peptide peptidase SppA
MTESARPEARYIKPGEVLAIDSSWLRSDVKGFFWLFGGGSKQNERRGNVAIVHVRGELDHHDSGWGESYEGIVRRLTDASTGADALLAHKRKQQEHEWRHKYDDDYQPMADAAQTPPSAIVMCIDSPGGLVSGLFETVKTIKSLRKSTGIKVVAYVNELAASAAYALACACDEIVAPPHATIGSIGAIAALGSFAAKNAKDGIDVRLITSGKRKADGNPNIPISDGAVAARQKSVDQAADAFFQVVSSARRISIDKIRGFEAGVFSGTDGKARGLVDAVRSYDETIASLDSAQKSLDKPLPAGSTRPTVARVGASASSKETGDMNLSARAKRILAAISTETDPDKLLALTETYAAYKKVEKHVEHTTSEEDDGEEDPDGDGGEEKDDDDAKKAKKAEGDDEEAKKAAAAAADGDEDEKKEAKAALAVYRELSASLGVKGAGNIRGALAAALEKADKVDSLSAQVQGLIKTQTAATKNALIDEAVAARRITRKQGADLRDKKMSFVESYLKMNKTPLVNVDEDAIEVGDPKASAADVPAAVKKITEQSITAQSLTGEAADKFREQAYADYRKANSNTNGVY